MKKQVVLFITVLLICTFSISAQPFQQNFLSGNNVYTQIDNRSAIATFNEGLFWPGAGGVSHAYAMGLLIGGEVTNVNGDVIHIVSDGLDSGSGGDINPQGGSLWGWLPMPGYTNPQEDLLALSNDMDSWPPSWTAWPGVNGIGTQSADLEAVWLMSDSSNAEFEYYPNPADSSIRGLGLQVLGRAFQWDSPENEDFIIFRYDITNASPKPLDKLTVGFYADPHIGGNNDFADDFAGVSLENDIILFWDEDGIGDGGVAAPPFAFVVLEAPDNVGLTSGVVKYFGLQGTKAREDEKIWQAMRPDSVYVEIGSGDILFISGSGDFSLAPGETKTYSVATILGGDIAQKYTAVKNAFSTLVGIPRIQGNTAPQTIQLEANYPNPFNPTTTIRYTLSTSGYTSLTVSNMLGQPVKTLLQSKQPAGSYSVDWDGTNSDGAEVSSGVYFYSLQSGEQVKSRKMILMR